MRISLTNLMPDPLPKLDTPPPSRQSVSAVVFPAKGKLTLADIGKSREDQRRHAKAADPARRRRRSDQMPTSLTAQQVRAWRKRMEMTVDGARKALGMSKSAYIEMERQGTSSRRTLLALRALKHAIHLLPKQKYEQFQEVEE